MKKMTDTSVKNLTNLQEICGDIMTQMTGVADAMVELAKMAASHMPKGFDFEKEMNSIDVDEFDKRNVQRLNAKYRISRKRNMYRSSIFNEPGVLDQHFKDFKVETAEQKEALYKAKVLTKRIIDGDKFKAVFTGTAGSGKTMLAVCMLNNINENSKLNLTCLFVSFPKLIEWERIRAGGTDEERVLKIESAIKAADVLVWDDLGSESLMRSDQTNEASEYVQRTMFNLADARKNKVDVFTTNNSSAELTKLYNPKLISRMLTNNPDNIIKFSGKDCRLS